MKGTLPRFRAALFVAAVVAAVAAAIPASAGIGDSPLPKFSDMKDSVAILAVPGVVNRSGTATVFLCSSISSTNVDIGVQVFDEAGVLQNNVTSGAGAVLNVAPGATATIATSATMAFLESTIITVSPSFSQGSARVVASSSSVHCSVFVAEDGTATPVSVSTLPEATPLVSGAQPPATPLPTFSDNSPAAASAIFPGTVSRGSFETAVFCTSVAAGPVHIGVEVLAADGTVENSVHAGDGAVLGVAPGQTVTFATGGTAALLETSFLTLPASIAQGMARVVSTSPDVLCSAMSLDSFGSPPGSTTNLAGYGATPAAATATLPAALPTFFDGKPSVHIATVPGVIKRGQLQTLFLCSSRSSTPVDIGVQVFDLSGTLLNDVSADVGAVRDVAPGATVTIATSTTAAYLETTVIPLAAGLQGVGRIVASSNKVSCSAVVVADAATPPTTLLTLGAAVQPTAGALPASIALPKFSNNNQATHSAVFPGLTKRNDVETDILCTSIASQPIDIGVQVLMPDGSVANDVSVAGPGNGALLSVAPGSTVTFGTTGTAALFESQVITLSAVAQGMARVISNSGDLVCNALVLDQLTTPPASMSALTGFAAMCGDGIVQASEQCDGTSDAACPGACGSDCLCPGVCGDGFVQAGEACDDGNVMGGDCCSATCQLECDDANPCTADTCDVMNGACTHDATPQTSCLEAGKSAFQLKQGTTDAKNQLKWKWLAGPQVLYDDLGSPDGTDTYSLCVYDSTSGVATVATFLEVPPSSLWTTRPGSSWTYTDKTATADGVSSVKLSAGVAGRSKLSVKAAGVNLPMPTPVGPTKTFDLQPSLTVQMTNDHTAACWKSTFSAASLNDGVGFKAKKP